jgi:hypothetical protein
MPTWGSGARSPPQLGEVWRVRPPRRPRGGASWSTPPLGRQLRRHPRQPCLRPQLVAQPPHARCAAPIHPAAPPRHRRASGRTRFPRRPRLAAGAASSASTSAARPSWSSSARRPASSAPSPMPTAAASATRILAAAAELTPPSPQTENITRRTTSVAWPVRKNRDHHSAAGVEPLRLPVPRPVAVAGLISAIFIYVQDGRIGPSLLMAVWGFWYSSRRATSCSARSAPAA